MADQEEPATSFRRMKKRPKTLRQQEIKQEPSSQPTEGAEDEEAEVRWAFCADFV